MTNPLSPIVDGKLAAFDNFAALLVEIAGVDLATANKVTALYLKEKLAKSDHIARRITVKHGALLDREAILRAAALVNG